MVVSAWAVFQANSCFCHVQEVLHRLRYYALGDILLVALGPLVEIEQITKPADNLKITVSQLHPHTDSVFPTRNEIFQQDNAHVTRLELC
ncbi:hypothetical protein TNCV_330371 [Trichonephila clavipes]|nr:hypothetical protein TNCV_330371 [Trichonephila clavipes]